MDLFEAVQLIQNFARWRQACRLVEKQQKLRRKLRITAAISTNPSIVREQAAIKIQKVCTTFWHSGFYSA